MTLLIETTLQSYLVALINNKKVVDYIFYEELVYKSDVLDEDVRNLLNKNKVTISDLSSINVTKGPGSFMGIRAGLMFANTLATVLGIDLCTATSFEFLSAKDGIKKIYIDAKGGESYYEEFPNGKPEIKSFAPNTKLDLNDFLANTEKYISKFKKESNPKPFYMKEPRVG